LKSSRRCIEGWRRKERKESSSKTKRKRCCCWRETSRTRSFNTSFNLRRNWCSSLSTWIPNQWVWRVLYISWVQKGSSYQWLHKHLNPLHVHSFQTWLHFLRSSPVFRQPNVYRPYQNSHQGWMCWCSNLCWETYLWSQHCNLWEDLLRKNCFVQQRSEYYETLTVFPLGFKALSRV